MQHLQAIMELGLRIRVHVQLLHTSGRSGVWPLGLDGSPLPDSPDFSPCRFLLLLRQEVSAMQFSFGMPNSQWSPSRCSFWFIRGLSISLNAASLVGNSFSGFPLVWSEHRRSKGEVLYRLSGVQGVIWSLWLAGHVIFLLFYVLSSACHYVPDWIESIKIDLSGDYPPLSLRKEPALYEMDSPDYQWQIPARARLMEPSLCTSYRSLFGFQCTK